MSLYRQYTLFNRLCQVYNWFFELFFDIKQKNNYIYTMSLTQKIRILLVKQGNISEAELARRLNTSPNNLNQKMKRDNFSENELRKIAEVLDCDLKIAFIDKQTKEET